MIYYLYNLLEKVFNEKISNILVSVILIAILVSPFVFKIEPEVLLS